jgi:para-aminobenzoate synthetase/4-amino-4-deoxychorismate lyase
LELVDGHGTMGAGSGIVIDSDPADEFRECLLKASFLTGPAHRTSDSLILSQPDKLFLIETMLWNGSYPLLELHLDRLAVSAEYFDFGCDRLAVSTALERHAHQFVFFSSTPKATSRSAASR